MSTWEIALMYDFPIGAGIQYSDENNRTSVFALTNGGTAGMIWGYLIVWVGYMMVFATIAEMASM
jgi:choline transport protein